MASKHRMHSRKTMPRQTLACTLAALLGMIQGHQCQAAQANFARPARQRPKPASGFPGDWKGATYWRTKSRRPVGVNVNRQPANQVHLTLTQKGQELSGEYGASIDWGRRFEFGEFNAKLSRNTTTVVLESGWGGKVTVALTLRDSQLDWRVINAEGENYFPAKITLRRSK